MNGTSTHPENSNSLLDENGRRPINPVLIAFLSSTLSMAIVGAIPYLVSDSYINISVIALFAILMVFIVLVSLTLYLFGTKRKELKDGYNQLKKSKKLSLLFLLFYAVGLGIVFFGLSIIIPAFQISSPNADSEVGPNIIVAGNGAIPGNPVAVWVIDDLGKSWLQGQTVPTQQGEWILQSVQIGREGTDIGKKFTIFAQTQNKEGKMVNSKSIIVIRK